MIFFDNKGSILKFDENSKLIWKKNYYTKSEKKLKLSKFGTFSTRLKKARLGRNPKTKENKTISQRYVVLFKPSKEFKDFINSKDNA